METILVRFSKHHAGLDILISDFVIGSLNGGDVLPQVAVQHRHNDYGDKICIFSMCAPIIKLVFVKLWNRVT